MNQALSSDLRRGRRRCAPRPRRGRHVHDQGPLHLAGHGWSRGADGALQPHLAGRDHRDQRRDRRAQPAGEAARFPRRRHGDPAPRWPAQRTISQLPSSHFPRLAEESRLLRWLAEGAPGAEHAELERRRVMREAMIVRDVAWEAIRNVLPPRSPPRDRHPGRPPRDARRSRRQHGCRGHADRRHARRSRGRARSSRPATSTAPTRPRSAATPWCCAPTKPTPPRPSLRRGGRACCGLIGMAYRALRTDAFLTVRAPRSRRAIAALSAKLASSAARTR